MQVITLINQKGGAGKSTLARGLLSAADARGMRAGFLGLAGDFPDRITVIDGARAPEQVAQDILGVVTSRLR